VRSSIVTAIEALTPTTTDIGEPTFKHISDEQLFDVSRDRLFVVQLVSPPSHFGVTTITGRWLTAVEIVVYYERTRYYTTDQDRIAEDCQQIQETILSYDNHSTDCVGVIAQGEQYVYTKLDEDSDGYVLTISLSIHHL
jgi:hypothetical protein